MTKIPVDSYGVLQQHVNETPADKVVEQVQRLGFALLDSGYSSDELDRFSDTFDKTHEAYLSQYGKDFLESKDEHNTIRAPLLISEAFMQLATNANLLAALGQLIPGKFILNQQNGVINPSNEAYNQGFWHRDLPYQHYTSSRPLAVNALFCIDDFTFVNGATFVLPASHKTEEYPSPDYIKANALQVEARRGQFILLDCMIFHAGGFNRSDRDRRAVNHVFNIPYFKQQINITRHVQEMSLPDDVRELLGCTYTEPESVSDYLSRRGPGKY